MPPRKPPAESTKATERGPRTARRERARRDAVSPSVTSFLDLTALHVSPVLSGVPDEGTTVDLPIDGKPLPRIDPAYVVPEVLERAELAEQLLTLRADAALHFGKSLAELPGQLDAIAAFEVERPLPAALVGRVRNPDGSGARQLQVEIGSATGTSSGGAASTLTADDGSFHATVPELLRHASTDPVFVRIAGADGSTRRQRDRVDVGPNGVLADIVLETPLEPLSTSVVAQLGAVVAAGGPVAAPVDVPERARVTPLVTLGEDDCCGREFGRDASVNRFPYSVLVRLVEPRPSVVSLALTSDGFGWWLPADTFNSLPGNVRYTFTERLPVERPVSVDEFRRGVAGISPNGVVSQARTVPIAGTLGLGYVVRMAQQWTPTGLALGDLVYSLPLAPGEQQRVAVVERSASQRILDEESLSEAEHRAFSEVDDTSAQATFDSAFRELANGGSSFQTSAETSSWGVAGGVGAVLGPVVLGGGAAAGGGSSSASGSTANWMSGTRDYTSRATQATHASVQRQASARRAAHRTGVRLASERERTEVVTKVITNHNKAHAMTVQYWEVLRMFDVTSVCEGVTLVCFVPLDIVRFLPAGEPVVLPGGALNRGQVLRRYGALLTHADTLRPRLPRRLRKGIDLLEDFAADPRTQVETGSGAAHDQVDFTVTGTFLPNEDVSVRVRLRSGARLGPVPLNGDVPPLPAGDSAFTSETELVAFLRARRRGTATTLTASLALPLGVPRNDVVGFEVSRRFRRLDYRYRSPLLDRIAALRASLGDAAASLLSQAFADAVARERDRDATFSADRLEELAGGPFLTAFSAKVGGLTYASVNHPPGAVEIGTAAVPVAAVEIPPVLEYGALLEIERTLQHVLRNTTTYSKAVWTSLTPEERVMLLEGFTIGVPGDGVADASQDVPLLSCVTNQVLGYYGNCMIMPFMVPMRLVGQLTTANVQDTLTRFHQNGFSPPVSTVALPTRGVLGEAVLGRCASAEKIDLTRFWNWQDSPGDEATAIQPVGVPAANLLAGESAPSALTGLPPLIANFSNAAPTAGTGLAEALARGGAEARGFADMTGSDNLARLLEKEVETSDKARADALGKAQSLATAAMGHAVDLRKKQMDLEAQQQPGRGAAAHGSGSGAGPARQTSPQRSHPAPGSGGSGGGGTNTGATGGSNTGGTGGSTSNTPSNTGGLGRRPRP